VNRVGARFRDPERANQEDNRRCEYSAPQPGEGTDTARADASNRAADPHRPSSNIDRTCRVIGFSPRAGNCDRLVLKRVIGSTSKNIVVFMAVVMPEPPQS